MAEGGGLLRLPGDHRTGLKSMISGPFFIGNLVGVGCRMMVLGTRLGTLVGTLDDANVCLLSTRRARPSCAAFNIVSIGLLLLAEVREQRRPLLRRHKSTIDHEIRPTRESAAGSAADSGAPLV